MTDVVYIHYPISLNIQLLFSVDAKLIPVII